MKKREMQIIPRFVALPSTLFVDLTDQFLNFQRFLAADKRFSVIFYGIIEIGDLADMLESPIVLSILIMDIACILCCGKNRAVVKLNSCVVIAPIDLTVFTAKANFYRLITGIVVHCPKSKRSTAFVADKPFARIVNLHDLVPTVGKMRLYRNRLIIYKPVGKIDRMDRLVDDNATALLIPSPLPIGELIILIRLAPR